MPYRLIWRQDGQGHAVEEWDAASGSFKPSASQAVTEQRFPVRLFSQGQIAALAGDSQQALLKVMTMLRHAIAASRFRRGQACLPGRTGADARAGRQAASER
jgi:hypothetical protein